MVNYHIFFANRLYIFYRIFNCQFQMNIIPKSQKKQEDPSRDLQQAQLYNQNNNSIEGNSNRSKNKTIRLLSADDYFKSKITELQQEINRLRCQLSNVDCNNIRQRNGFLNKIEIMTMENAELKQHQNNLNKVINTLKQALRPKHESQNYENQRQGTLSDKLKIELQQKAKVIKQQKWTIDQLKKQLRVLKDQKYHIELQRDTKIEELVRKNKLLIADRENQMDKVQKTLNRFPFNEQVMQAILKALNLHVKADLSCDDLDFEQKLQQSPVAMRTPVPDRRCSSRVNDTSYSRISSRSIISQLNNNRPSDYESDYYEEDQEQRLLCQNCNMPFEQNQFIEHMDQCQLEKKRKELEKTISQIDLKQRESVSQRKWQNKQKNEETLRAWDQNSRSPCKLTRRESSNPYNNQPDQMKKKISNYNKPQANVIGYRSTKFY